MNKKYKYILVGGLVGIIPFLSYLAGLFVASPHIFFEILNDIFQSQQGFYLILFIFFLLLISVCVGGMCGVLLWFFDIKGWDFTQRIMRYLFIILIILSTLFIFYFKYQDISKNKNAYEMSFSKHQYRVNLPVVSQ